MPNFMIINGKNEYFEYVAENDLDVLDRYVEEKLGFESGFTVSKTFWNELKSKINDSEQYDIDDRVRLVNGFCKNRRHRIERVLTGYSIDYPTSVEVKFVNNNESHPEIFVYNANSENLGQEVIVPYGDTLGEIYLVAAKGYEIKSVSVTDAKGNNIINSEGENDWAYDEVTGYFVGPSKITSQTKVRVTTEAISSDWRVALRLHDTSMETEEICYCYVQDGDEYTCELPVSWSESIINSVDGCRITTSIVENGSYVKESTDTSTKIPPTISIPNVCNHLYVSIQYEPYYSS